MRYADRGRAAALLLTATALLVASGCTQPDGKSDIHEVATTELTTTSRPTSDTRLTTTTSPDTTPSTTTTTKPPTTTATTGPELYPQGVSGWEYGDDVDRVIDDIRAYDAVAPADRQFRYLFPYVGSLDIGPSRLNHFDVWYSDAPTSCTYAAALPGVLMLGNVDAHNLNGRFDGWTDAEYEQAARMVADAVIADSCADGVSIDIEPYHASHIPFYRHLRDKLSAAGKLTSMFVGWRGADAELFGAVDIIAISGYDFGPSPSDPVEYGRSMDIWLGRLEQIASAADGWFLMGLPASASWGEWESREGPDCGHEESGYTMEQYVSAAIDAMQYHTDDERLLGTALWVMGKDDSDACSGCCNLPRTIRPTVWELLWSLPSGHRSLDQTTIRAQ